LGLDQKLFVVPNTNFSQGFVIIYNVLYVSYSSGLYWLIAGVAESGRVVGVTAGTQERTASQQ
jgi:hypothetical protein